MAQSFFAHPTADVSPRAIIGAGTKIWQQCQVREDVVIGQNCILSKDVYVDAGVHVGNNVKIQNGISVYHGVTLEDGVFCGPHCVFTNDKQPRAINPDASLKSAAGWWIWQIVYYGPGTFLENAAKLSQLAASTTGFDLRTAAEGLQYVFGPESGHYYYFFGIPALIYVGITCLRRTQESLVTAFLVLFTCLWLAYFVFWIVPASMYFVAIGIITALFVAKLWQTFLSNSSLSWRGIVAELRQGKPGQAVLTVIAAVVLVLTIVYPLQRTIRLDVLARDDSPNQLMGPQEVAAYLTATIDQHAIVETWERELAIMTDLTNHFPDQSIMAKTQAALHRGGAWNYALGEDYFQAYHVSYVVVGWYARFSGLYDMKYLTEHSTLLTTIGHDEWRYEVFKLRYQ